MLINCLYRQLTIGPHGHATAEFIFRAEDFVPDGQYYTVTFVVDDSIELEMPCARLVAIRDDGIHIEATFSSQTSTAQYSDAAIPSGAVSIVPVDYNTGVDFTRMRNFINGFIYAVDQEVPNYRDMLREKQPKYSTQIRADL